MTCQLAKKGNTCLLLNGTRVMEYYVYYVMMNYLFLHRYQSLYCFFYFNRKSRAFLIYLISELTFDC